MSFSHPWPRVRQRPKLQEVEIDQHALSTITLRSPGLFALCDDDSVPLSQIQRESDADG